MIAHGFPEGVGYVGATLTTVAFVPQVLRSRRAGAEGVSASMYVLYAVGAGCWLAYGIALGAWPVIVSNGITCALSSLVAVQARRRG